MNAWVEELKNILYMLIGRDSQTEMIWLAVICLMLILLFFPRVSVDLGGRGKFWLLCLFTGVLFLSAAPAAVLAFTDLNPVFSAAATLLVLMVLVVPLTVYFEQLSYFRAFLLWGLCAILIAGVLTAEKRTANFVRKESQWIEKRISRNMPFK